MTPQQQAEAAAGAKYPLAARHKANPTVQEMEWWDLWDSKNRDKRLLFIEGYLAALATKQPEQAQGRYDDCPETETLVRWVKATERLPKEDPEVVKIRGNIHTGELYFKSYRTEVLLYYPSYTGGNPYSAQLQYVEWLEEYERPVQAQPTLPHSAEKEAATALKRANEYISKEWPGKAESDRGKSVAGERRAVAKKAYQAGYLDRASLGRGHND